LRTFSYRPRKVRLAGAAVLAAAIVALLGGIFRLTGGASPGGNHDDRGAGRAGPAAVAEIRIEVGRDYPVELSTHCGLTVTEFAGRRWKAERSGGMTQGPVTPGIMRLLDVDTLRFTAADTGLVVVFRPTVEPPPACT
jgi:hypothetical protein